MTDRPESLHYDPSRRFPSPLPVSGAWRHGDQVGRRQFAKVSRERPFVLECGGHLDEVEIAYETWGTLDVDGSNAVLLLHAWTGDSHAAGRAARCADARQDFSPHVVFEVAAAPIRRHPGRQ